MAKEDPYNRSRVQSLYYPPINQQIIRQKDDLKAKNLSRLRPSFLNRQLLRTFFVTMVSGTFPAKIV